MALEDSVKGSTDDGPFVQFEDCVKYDKECQYRDNLGKCIYETCVYDNELPPTTTTWYSRCMFCNEEYARPPQKMKIRLCDNCLKRAQAAEVLPFTCVFCGASQSHPSKIFLSGICDKCFGAIKNAINCKKCGN